ncbi:MAG: proline--tRNA ligase [Magnetococcales bacterium]|nr:proline--tRNA ligase [Magnetococcales bacterium]
MRLSQTFVPTLKEDPVEAQVASHKLMLRSGMIRQLGAGIYNWLPLGLRVLRKVETIVREEMDRAGAQEVLMPSIQPAELWQESGRWKQYGPELLRIRDRGERNFCYGPTHEEVITDLVRHELRSYKQLPANFYQIQTKFRDEVRPRFGIMRGREFLMKDAYSFDLDQTSLDRSYEIMFEAYSAIFRRCGLTFRAVEADTGAIGGADSHEFHVLASSGEDEIASCNHCSYAANIEKAVPGKSKATPVSASGEGLSRVETPGIKTIDEVADFLKVPHAKTVKSLVVETSEGACMLLLRGDHALNEIKAAHLLDGEDFHIPDAAYVQNLCGVPVGSLGPVGTALPVIADWALADLTDFVCGANQEGWHLTSVNWERDLPRPRFADLRNVQPKDPCPRCDDGQFGLFRGIEVGHVFKLGDKYTKSMKMTVLNQEGREQTPLMGCYGIGVSRTVAAAIEQNHDENGIIWPIALAPFQVEILLVNPKETEAAQLAESLYVQLKEQGFDPLLDDRNERLGVKFKDADLIGAPIRAVIGGRGLQEGVVEVQTRKEGRSDKIPVVEIGPYLTSQLQGLIHSDLTEAGEG